MLKQIAALGLGAGLCIAAPLEAQRIGPSSIQITPYAGYMKFGNIANGPLGTSLRNAGSVVYGGELSLGFSPALALVGNIAYSQPDLQIGAPILGGISVGQGSVLLYDAALRLRIPTGGVLPISPFIQGGAGAVRQSLSIGPVGTHETSFATNIGAGADIALAPRLGLQLMAKDYIGKFDAKEATAIDVHTRTTHNWAISAGLRLGL
jgi:Outer membrane protein beta-barrel domain